MHGIHIAGQYRRTADSGGTQYTRGLQPACFLCTVIQMYANDIYSAVRLALRAVRPTPVPSASRSRSNRSSRETTQRRATRYYRRGRHNNR